MTTGFLIPAMNWMALFLPQTERRQHQASHRQQGRTICDICTRVLFSVCLALNKKMTKAPERKNRERLQGRKGQSFKIGAQSISER
jgi:hypothetical protein